MNKRLEMRVDDQLKSDFKKVANSNGVSTSAYLRVLMQKVVSNEITIVAIDQNKPDTKAAKT